MERYVAIAILIILGCFIFAGVMGKGVGDDSIYGAERASAQSSITIVNNGF